MIADEYKSGLENGRKGRRMISSPHKNPLLLKGGVFEDSGVGDVV